MAAQLDNLNSLGPIDPRAARVRRKCQASKGEESPCPKGQRKQSNVPNGLTRVDLWHWVINHDVPRSETGKAQAPASAIKAEKLQNQQTALLNHSDRQS